MTSNIDITKRLNKAAIEKDYRAVESLLHPQYSFRDPIVSFDNPKDFIAFMKDCPFDGGFEATTFIADGDRVVQIVDCLMTKPAKFKMHMCDVLTFKDGKVIAEEVFFDTAQIPEEARETMDNLLPHKKAA